MAFYKEEKYLKQIDHEAFDTTMRPGEEVQYSGIYKCINCGKEVASNEGDGLPPQNHGQHEPQRVPGRGEHPGADRGLGNQ